MVDRERTFIGDYERFQWLGEGAMGAVYLARHLASDEIVALKVAKKEIVGSPAALALFRQQGKTESALHHPNILHVQGAGTHEGHPFLVMPLMEGGSLAEPDNAARFAPPRARLKLVLTIARAVQFAHERGVLHCDLKHDNILFDGNWEPRVADFGMARTIGAAQALDRSAVRGGTPGWMSPEQLTDEALTTASDVFALGVMLHWLRTSELPFGSGADFPARLASEPAPAVGPWSPDLEWGLSAVTHRALQREPKHRYDSAAALAEDLDRVQNQRPIHGWKVPLWGRAWYWTARHPGARNAIFLLLPCFALVALLVSRAQREELRRTVLDVNAYAASGQAATVLYQMRQYADLVDQAAELPRIKALVLAPRRTDGTQQAGSTPENPCAQQTELADPAPLDPYRRHFSAMLLLDRDGCARARASNDVEGLQFIQHHFALRDYFTGAQADAYLRLKRSHVRMAYRSSISKRMRFAVSAPLFEKDRWIGVLSGGITAASTLELPRMRRSENDSRLTALVGPFEGEGGAGIRSRVREFAFLAHPKLEVGQKVVLNPRWAEELGRAFRGPGAAVQQFDLGTALPLQTSDYVDPLLGDRWLAAFAPVGGTGFVVVVQTRDAVATRPSNGLTQLAGALAGASSVLLLTWAAFFAWRWRRERAPLSRHFPSARLS
ncbi:MAG TPA: protein kinase [Polyangiaceae bacterium]|nr:protein kinase [Polyangiaceae bacterium]